MFYLGSVRNYYLLPDINVHIERICNSRADPGFFKGRGDFCNGGGGGRGSDYSLPDHQNDVSYELASYIFLMC